MHRIDPLRQDLLLDPFEFLGPKCLGTPSFPQLRDIQLHVRRSHVDAVLAGLDWVTRAGPGVVWGVSLDRCRTILVVFAFQVVFNERPLDKEEFLKDIA